MVRLCTANPTTTTTIGSPRVPRSRARPARRQLGRLAAHRHHLRGDGELHGAVELAVLAHARTSGRRARSVARRESTAQRAMLSMWPSMWRASGGIRVGACGQCALVDRDSRPRIGFCTPTIAPSVRAAYSRATVSFVVSTPRRRCSIAGPRSSVSDSASPSSARRRSVGDHRRLIERTPQVCDRGVGRATRHGLAGGVAQPVADPRRVARLGREPERLAVGLRPAARRRPRGRAASGARRRGHIPAACTGWASRPAVADRPATLLELGLAESLTLDRGPAIEHLRRGVETTQDTVARLYAALVGVDGPFEAVALVERATRRQPLRLPLHIEGHMLSMARWAISSRRAAFMRATRAVRARAGRRARRADGADRRRAGGPDGRRVGELTSALAGRRDRGTAGRSDRRRRRRVRRAVPDDGRPSDRAEVLTATIDEARRARANYHVAYALRSDARFRAGALRDAVADAEAARHSYAHAGQLTVLGAASARAGADRAPASWSTCTEEAPLGGWRDRRRLQRHAVRPRPAAPHQGDAEAALADALEAGRRQEAAQDEPRVRRLALAGRARLRRAARPAGGRAAARAPGARAGAPVRRPARDRDRAAHGRPASSSRSRRRPPCWAPRRRGCSTPRARRPRRRAAPPPPRGRGARPAAAGARPGRPLRRRATRRARSHRVADGARPRRAELSGVAALTTNERRRWPPTGARCARSPRSCT